MPQPGEARPHLSAEDSFLELLAETLDGLEESLRAAFLTQLFRTLTRLNIPEKESIALWDQILDRRREMMEALGRPVSFKTAMVDVLGETGSLRLPLLIEYDELKQLRINAAMDALTGLYNRRLFDESSQREMNRARRYGHHLAIVLLDLHKLKEVNDQQGHLQGDRVLQLAAGVLRKTLRASDSAFRIGGDEFALLLPQTDANQAIALCRRLRSRYESDVRTMGIEIGVTLDFGAAVYPEDGEGTEHLIELADQRLYELKHANRAPSMRGGPRVAPVEAPTAGGPSPTPAGPPAEAPSARETRHEQAPPAPRQSSQDASGAAAARERRKWERVSLAGTHARAEFTNDGQKGQKPAGVIDLSYGGVALRLDPGLELPEQFSAVLHVPILPPVRVVLHKTYTQRLESGQVRVGCSFVS